MLFAAPLLLLRSPCLYTNRSECPPVGSIHVDLLSIQIELG